MNEEKTSEMTAAVKTEERVVSENAAHVKTEEPVTPAEAAPEKVVMPEQAGSGSKLPVPNASNKAIGVITVIYVLFVIALTAGLIALSIFLFGKLWNLIT